MTPDVMSANPAPAPFAIPVRIYYEDTDIAGVVYYANYLRYLERARSDWLRAEGIELDVVQRDLGAVFVVRRVEADYLQPALLGNLLTVTAEPIEVGASRMTILQRVLRREGERDTLLFTARVTAAFVAADLGGPVRMPRAMRDALKKALPPAITDPA